jgi:small conductance mechanosensitive channel
MKVKFSKRLGKLIRVSIRWILLLAILITIIIPVSVVAQDERVTVRLDGRSVFRVSAIENIDATARARQVERRLTQSIDLQYKISFLLPDDLYLYLHHF